MTKPDKASAERSSVYTKNSNPEVIKFFEQEEKIMERITFGFTKLKSGFITDYSVFISRHTYPTNELLSC